MKSLTKIIFLFAFYLCFSQTKNTSFEILNINNSPFSKKINVLFEDHFGFLWFGTNNGLYRYDGYDIIKKQYDVFDKHSLPNNNINSIIEDSYGNLWLGSESFLIVYNKETNIFKGFYRDKKCKVIGKSTSGILWAYIQGTGVVEITPNKDINQIKFNTELNYKNKKTVFNADVQINQFLEDKRKRNWFVSSKGIVELDTTFNFLKTSFKKNTISLYEYVDNQYIAVCRNGVYVLKNSEDNLHFDITKKFLINDLLKTDSQNVNINSSFEDKKNNTIWIGTNQGVLKVKLEKGQFLFSNYKVNNENSSNLSNHINSLIVGKNKNLWIGTQKGVGKLLRKSFIFEYNSLGKEFSDLYVHDIFPEDRKQSLVGISGKGIYRYNLENNTKELFLETNKGVGMIKKDPTSKELFIGIGRVLVKTKNYTQTQKKAAYDTIKVYPKSIHDIISVNDEIWVGLWSKGIDIITTDEELSSFKKKVMEKISDLNVFSMLLDKSNNIWIGTRGAGLFKVDLDNEKLTHFKPKKVNGICSNGILCIREGRNNDIWIGTRGGGLNKYNSSTNTFETFGKVQGLLSNTVSGIEEDEKGNLWLSTQEGISLFDVKEKTFKNFGQDEGIKLSQFSFNSCAKYQDKVFFGGISGLYQVNTELFRKSESIPNIMITDFSIFGNKKENEAASNKNQELRNKVYTSQKIDLKYNENNVILKFSSLDFTSPFKNQYAYILEGVNKDWLYTDAFNRSANYNNLSPGDYIFRVKGTNSDGVWNNNPATLCFTILPPFWKSPSAIILYVFLIISGLLFSFYLIKKWYKLKQGLLSESVSRQKDNEYHQMKMVFFTDISHELRTPLTLIKGAIDKVVSEKKYTISSLTAQRIYNNTIRIDRLINQIMDIRKYDVGEFKLRVSKNNIMEDIEKIKNAFGDIAEINNIDYSFTSNSSSQKSYWYDYQILEKILFNLLSNAFKYTPNGGKIEVRAEYLTSSDPFEKKKKAQYLKCKVIDTGIGIDQEDIPFIFNRFYQTKDIPKHQVPGTGVGMELVQKLVKLHKGFITVNSKKNESTEFVFQIPIKKKNYSSDEISLNNIESRSTLLSSLEKYDNNVSDLDENKSTTKNDNTKPKVLIVEDNAELLKIMEEELVGDFDVLKASNGREGYNKIIDEKPQLILSDISMPEEDGLSMLKRVKENNELSHIPIFMLTARGSDEIKIDCLRIGADDFIEKPFSFEFVKWKIKNTLFTQRNLKEKYSRIISAEPSKIEIESNDEKFVKKLIEVIESYIDDDLLSVEFLASEVGMSRANLYRKLKNITGDTPVEFIKKIRLKRATQLLKNDSFYISEVAHMTGFNNLKYFSKCFKKEYGVTPSQFASSEA